jgi:hypothetical protein
VEEWIPHEAVGSKSTDTNDVTAQQGGFSDEAESGK